MMESPTYGNRPRVLIVDDEPSICKALEIALGRAGFEAIATRCGEAAITKLSTEHFDALLLDLRIPDMRGDVLFELAVAHQPHLRTQTLPPASATVATSRDSARIGLTYAVDLLSRFSRSATIRPFHRSITSMTRRYVSSLRSSAES